MGVGMGMGMGIWSYRVSWTWTHILIPILFPIPSRGESLSVSICGWLSVGFLAAPREQLQMDCALLAIWCLHFRFLHTWTWRWVLGLGPPFLVQSSRRRRSAETLEMASTNLSAFLALDPRFTGVAARDCSLSNAQPMSGSYQIWLYSQLFKRPVRLGRPANLSWLVNDTFRRVPGSRF